MSDIKDKIRNLLAKAEDSAASDAEAKSAYAMASKLMTKHSLEKSDLETQSAESPVKERAPGNSPQCPNFEAWVAQGASKLYNALTWIRTQPDGSKHIMFGGRPEALDAAELTYAYLMLQLNRDYKAALPKGLPKRERALFRRDFKEGFAIRIRERCFEAAEQSRKELEQESNGTALVIHTDQLQSELTDYAVSIGLVKSRSRASARKSVDYDARARGSHSANRADLPSTIG